MVPWDGVVDLSPRFSHVGQVRLRFRLLDRIIEISCVQSRGQVFMKLRQKISIKSNINVVRNRDMFGQNLGHIVHILEYTVLNQ